MTQIDDYIAERKHWCAHCGSNNTRTYPPEPNDNPLYVAEESSAEYYDGVEAIVACWEPTCGKNSYLGIE